MGNMFPVTVYSSWTLCLLSRLRVEFRRWSIAAPNLFSMTQGRGPILRGVTALACLLCPLAIARPRTLDSNLPQRPPIPDSSGAVPPVATWT